MDRAHTGAINRDMGNTQVQQPPVEAFCDLDTNEGLTLVQLYVMPSFFLAVLVLGLPLNLLSLWVFFHRLRPWSRSTVFLFNLTLADASWLLALPALVTYHLDHLHWRLGWPLCTGVRMLYHNYFYLSIFFVTCISVDRYLAIVHPLRSAVLLGRRRTCLLCVAVWTAALVLSIPVASMSLVQTCPGSNRTVCTLYILLSETEESLPYSLVCSIFGFLIPFLSICYCGLNSLRGLRNRPGCLQPDPAHKQRRLRRVLSSALVLFAVFYLPYHLSRNAAIVMRMLYPDSPASWRHADMAFALEMCFCSLISCVNPMLSCFACPQFRQEFHGVFSQCPAGTQPASVTSRVDRKRQKTATVIPVVELPAAAGP